MLSVESKGGRVLTCDALWLQIETIPRMAGRGAGRGPRIVPAGPGGDGVEDFCGGSRNGPNHAPAVAAENADLLALPDIRPEHETLPAIYRVHCGMRMLFAVQGADSRPVLGEDESSTTSERDWLVVMPITLIAKRQMARGRVFSTTLFESWSL